MEKTRPSTNLIQNLKDQLETLRYEKQQLEQQLLYSRGKVDEALKESEKKYRTIFEQAAVGIGRVSFQDAKWIDVNDAFCNMLGYTGNELMAIPWPEITHPDDIGLDLIPFQKMAAGKLGTYTVEKRFIHKKGHHVWARLTLSLVRNQQGDPDYEIAVIENISERKQAEEALDRIKERWNLALENFYEGAIIATEDEQVIYWNPAAQRMHGFTHEHEGIEPLEKTPSTFELWTPDGRHLLNLDEWPMKRIKRGEKVENYELRLRRPGQGWEKYVSYSGSMVKTSGGDKLIFLSVHDLTEQWKSARALRESEDRFRTLANNISQLAWMADSSGSLTWYNQRWYDYTGTTFEEMQGWGWTKVHHPDHLDRVVKKVQHSWDTGELWEDLFPLRGKDGKYRWYLSRAIPVRDPDGNIIRWFGTNTDVTEQRDIEKQLKKDNELFENLLYITAHDLKGPISNISMALNLLDKAAERDRQRLMQHLPLQVERLDKTIKGITEIVRIRKADASSAKLMHFEDILNDLLSEHKHEISSGSIKTSFRIKSIRYIEAFLESIMKNLVNNAIKYSRSDIPLVLEITTTQAENYILLTISDNGIGIDLASHRQQLFTPFLRIAPEKSTGTGIGLYLVKTIIEKNGGYIDLESEPGKGTTFYCYLKEYSE